MIYVIEGTGSLVNEAGEETALKAGDFAWLVPVKNASTAIRAINPLK